MRHRSCRKWFVAAFAGGLLLTLLFPGDIQFINDAPRAFKLAWEANRAGLPAAEGLPGSLGVSYHPLAIWLYQGALALTHNLLLIVLLKALLSVGLTMGALLLAARSLRLSAWPLLLLFAAPFLYVYQRMLWDNVMLIPVLAVLVAAYAWFARGGGFPAVATMGLGALFMIHLHLTSLVPLGTLGVVCLLCQRQRLRRHWRVVLAAGLAVLLLSLPYARHVLTGLGAPEKSVNPQIGPWWNGLRALAGVELLTYPGFYQHFRLAEGRLPALLPGGIVQLLAWLSMFLFVPFLAGICNGIRNIWRRYRRGRRLGLREQLVFWACMTLVANAILFSVFRQQYQPHYHNASWLAHFYLLWYGITGLYRRFPRILRVGSAGLSVILMLLLLNHITYVHVYGGNRYHTYGATLANQLAVARNVVRYPPPPATKVINLVHNYRHFPHCYRFLTGLTAHSAPPATKPAGRSIIITFRKADDDPYDGWITVRELPENP